MLFLMKEQIDSLKILGWVRCSGQARARARARVRRRCEHPHRSVVGRLSASPMSQTTGGADVCSRKQDMLTTPTSAPPRRNKGGPYTGIDRFRRSTLILHSDSLKADLTRPVNGSELQHLSTPAPLPACPTLCAPPPPAPRGTTDTPVQTNAARPRHYCHVSSL